MGRVLIADDSELVRLSLVRSARERGLDIIEASSVADAKVVDVGALSCALLDLDLGDGLGTEVAEVLRGASVALPIAFFMTKVATPRVKAIMLILVLLPLWASYLVKAYAWRAMFSSTGPIDWALAPFGLSGPGYGLPATVITLAYLWLPYMILPLYAGLERIPDSLLEASADLGAGPWLTIRRVVLPALFPALVAGSIFTFSLTMGDYIAVKIVGGTTQMLGNVVYDTFLTANNKPLAAAVSMIPVVVMLVYLALVRRTGALENV